MSEETERFMAVIEKHAATVTLDLLVDLTKALGFKLKVEAVPPTA